MALLWRYMRRYHGEWPRLRYASSLRTRCESAAHDDRLPRVTRSVLRPALQWRCRARSSGSSP